jgi:hypothetical protein
LGRRRLLGQDGAVATTSARSARSSARLTKRHLARLSKIAAEDRAKFYQAQPVYADRLVAVVLAQGAGLHYLDRTNGVADLDVWSFFSLPTGHDRFCADIRSTHVDFGPSDLGRQAYKLATARNERQRARWERWQAFEGRRVDLLMRGLACELADDPAEAIREWLARGTRKSAGSPYYLRQKGVIMIDPLDRRGEVVWDPR